MDVVAWPLAEAFAFANSSCRRRLKKIQSRGELFGFFFLVLRIYYEKNTRLTLRHLPLVPDKSPEESVEGSVEGQLGFGSVAKKRSAAASSCGHPSPTGTPLAFVIGYSLVTGLLTHLLF